MISYSPDTTPRLEGTVATHSCDGGYGLSVEDDRTCQSDRTWSGGNVTCGGKRILLLTCKCIQQIVKFSFVNVD